MTDRKTVVEKTGSHLDAARASRARAVIVHVACDGVGATLRETARLVGITEGAATSARRRGWAPLAAEGRTFDEVLAWRDSGGG